MQNFVVFTRGRTGSSAICEELDKYRSVVSHQELFRDIPGDPVTRDAWERFGEQCFIDPIRQELGIPDRLLPYQLYLETKGESANIAEYYAYLTENAQSRGATILGYKLLAHHYLSYAEQGLQQQLCSADTKVLYLMRKDPVREAISGASHMRNINDN